MLIFYGIFDYYIDFFAEDYFFIDLFELSFTLSVLFWDKYSISGEQTVLPILIIVRIPNIASLSEASRT